MTNMQGIKQSAVWRRDVVQGQDYLRWKPAGQLNTEQGLSNSYSGQSNVIAKLFGFTAEFTGFPELDGIKCLRYSLIPGSHA